MKPNLILGSYQVNLFPKNYFESDTQSLLKTLSFIPEFKDGQNNFIPIPSDAPRDIPRITLMSKNKIIRCEISFDKISLTWKNPNDDDSWIINESDIESLCRTIIVNTYKNLPTTRVGYVLRFHKVYKTKEKLLSTFGDKVINKKLLDSLSSIDLRFTFEEDIGENSKCNKAIWAQSGFRVKDKKPAIIIQTDINNRLDDPKTWSSDNVIEFLNNAQSFLDPQKIIRSNIFKMKKSNTEIPMNNTQGDQSQQLSSSQKDNTSSDYLTRQTDTLNSDLNKIKNDISQIQIKFIESLGIFVSLFTFISINFQILKETSFEKAIGLIFILSALLIVFIIILHLSLNIYINFIKYIFLVSIFIVTIFLFYQGTIWLKKSSNYNIKIPIPSPLPTQIIKPTNIQTS